MEEEQVYDNVFCSCGWSGTTSAEGCPKCSGELKAIGDDSGPFVEPE